MLGVLAAVLAPGEAPAQEWPQSSARLLEEMTLARVRLAAEQGVARLEADEARWRERLAVPAEGEESFRQLFGYDPPGRAMQLALLHAWLFEQEGDAADATTAAAGLARMAAYRDEVPEELREARVEYAGGLPAVPNFFHLADYADAWRRVRDCEVIPADTRASVEEAIAGSADFVFVFPEWGAHNRAMLRAESLLQCALALPEHDRAQDWRRMAEILAADSIGRWEIEDASLYHPIWLFALLRYADAAERPEIVRSTTVRWYLEMYQELLTPLGTAPDFGDAWWRSSTSRFFACLAWGAAALEDPTLQWAADRLYANLAPFDPERPDLGRARLRVLLDGRIDPALAPREPALRQGPLPDDVLAKKIVFRDGRGPGARYLLLNYRDEGDWGRVQRDFLRHTLAVEHEKMHHGHADENAIVSWMHDGAVLLHDGGYRDEVPSGPRGAWRAEAFHDRLVVRECDVGASSRGAFEDRARVESILFEQETYAPTRTELLDWVELDGAAYSRTRVIDPERGLTCDRVLVWMPDDDLLVVIDGVRADTAGGLLAAPLWHLGFVSESDAKWAEGGHRRIGNEEFPDTRRLQLFDLRPARDPGELVRLTTDRHRQEEHTLTWPRALRAEAGRWYATVQVLRSVAPEQYGKPLRPHPIRVEGVRVEAQFGASGEPGVAVRLRLGGREHLVACKLDLDLGLRRENVRPRWDARGASLLYGDLETDAELAIVTRQAGGGSWQAVNVSRLVLQGRALFESQPLQLFQVTGRSDVVGRPRWRRWQGEFGNR